MGTLKVDISCLTLSNCPLSSGGVGGLCALYSSNILCLKVGAGRSKVMTMCEGFHSDKDLMKALANPYTARTSSPVALTVKGCWMA